jgi:L-threonylcarbamoyladenylate synthase
MPTETVYGLGADAANETAVRRIFAAKGRPTDHPLIVHLASADRIDAWAEAIPETARALAAAFWPGPLTLVLRRRPEVLLAVTGGLPTVALRVPDHPIARELLDAFGGGIAAPSANRFAGVSPTSAADVVAELGDVVDFVLDGGPCRVGVESTIVDLSHGPPQLLRPGGVTREQLEATLGASLPIRSDGAVRAPGQHPLHYAPTALVELVTSTDLKGRAEAWLAAGRRVGILTLDGTTSTVASAHPLSLPPADRGGAAGLYAALRQADRLGLEVILAVPPARVGLGLAIADRLERAAGPRRPR